MLNQFIHGFCSFGQVWICEIIFNKPFITKIFYLIFKSQDSFKGWPVFSKIIINMNENFTVVTYQKICGKFATSKVIIVNLLKITADTFNGE